MSRYVRVDVLQLLSDVENPTRYIDLVTLTLHRIMREAVPGFVEKPSCFGSCMRFIAF